jgi:hypothetical protein
VTQLLTRRDTRDLALAFVTDPDRRAKIAARVGTRATRIAGAEVHVSRALEPADQRIAHSSHAGWPVMPSTR